MIRASLLLLVACSSSTKRDAATSTSVVLPGGQAGIGFDDLRFSPTLQRVLAPAGRTGKLDLVDPRTRAVESIDGFSSDETFGGGHGEGVTSVDEGAAHLFAIDRGRVEVVVVDANAKKIVATTKLAGSPDYVRWVAPANEVWVTEPGNKQIEYFAFDGAKLERRGALEVLGGPESLVIDATRGRAYTHTWDDETVVIDLATHAEVVRWKNGCAASRGIALDEPRGVLFVGCEEGRAIALDVAHDGKKLGAVETGKGVDIIAYGPKLAHLYVPADSGTLTIVGVANDGRLTTLGTLPAIDDAHCATTDDDGHVYVCDPKRGALLVIADPYPRL
jgi:DNA-binding beta-propeller fold protein YncE